MRLRSRCALELGRGGSARTRGLLAAHACLRSFPSRPATPEIRKELSELQPTVATRSAPTTDNDDTLSYFARLAEEDS